jgi:hypothetical protein
MLFAVTLSASGNVCTPDDSWDLTLRDIVSTCDNLPKSSDPETYWAPDDDPSEPGDSEYTYLARDNGADLPEKLIRAISICHTEYGDWARLSRLWDWATSRYNCYRSDLWWATCSDYCASGILDRAQLSDLLETLGVFANDTGTLGTLGGPAHPYGIAPDIDHTCESQECILTLRVTPLSDRITSESRWDRVRDAYLACYGL